eukprot:2914057-Pleurochrysis_carterae.AAC.5
MQMRACALSPTLARAGSRKRHKCPHPLACAHSGIHGHASCPECSIVCTATRIGDLSSGARMRGHLLPHAQHDTSTFSH